MHLDPEDEDPEAEEELPELPEPSMADENDDDTEEEDETRGTWLWWSRMGDMVSHGWFKMSSRPIRSLGRRRKHW